jgi:predicted transcriptional regulator
MKTENDPQQMFVPFKGSVDELLNHVNKLDPDEVEDVVVNQTKDVMLDDDVAIKMIQSELDCDEQMAKDVFNQIKLEEVDRVLKSLIEEGLVQVSEYKDGEPMYSLTDNGKFFAEKLKKTH